MGIIEDVKADVLEGIRLAERLIERFGPHPTFVADDGDGCPFEDAGPDDGGNVCAESEPEPSRGVRVATWRGPTILYSNADGWDINKNSELTVYEGGKVVGAHHGGTWCHVSHDSATVTA